MPLEESLRSAAERWLAEDPDPDTKQELARLLSQERADELADRFSGPLTFGTAGLRGLLGAGPHRMNHLVVARATAGLCAWVLEQVPGAPERGVVIGYDGRRKSRAFATLAAEIVVGAGLRARVFDHVVPTPLLAFAAKDRGAAAAIMVTASHNPPRYNGYKVYWENAAQIIPPHDRGIADAIAAVGAFADIPRVEREVALAQGRLEVLGDDVVRRYLDGVAALAVHPELPRDLTIAYTALHGVGDDLVTRALAEAGFERVHSVAEQAEPDGEFPTVDFPNPEEKGAMDLVLALAEREGADLVLANDPDADRLAVSIRADDGSYVALSGNEIGALLGHYVLDQGDAHGDRLVINSIVSSPMLGSIAHAHGARFEQVLTGFKWIANRALALAEEGARFVFGFEEALGYTVGPLVRDKDGVGAALVFADLAAWCRSRDRSVLDELEGCWRRYGMFLSRQVSIVLPGREGAAQIASIMQRVREAPPTRLGARDVVEVEDLATGARGEPADVLSLSIAGGHRVMLRPSGTEPKLKYYFDVRVELAEGQPLEAARATGEALIDELVDGLGRHIGEGGPAVA